MSTHLTHNLKYNRLFLGMIKIIPKVFKQKNSLPENTTKLGGKSLNLFRFYPTPKAIQIEKTLICHVLLGMLVLLQNPIPHHSNVPSLEHNCDSCQKE